MVDTITITFPDGVKKNFNKGINGIAIAESISKSLAKESVAIKLNGEVVDLLSKIQIDSSIEIIKKEHDDALNVIRHDCAHVMAEAVQTLYPDTQVTIGPAIENGFYYDFARDEPFTVSDLPKIEKKMMEIINKGEKFTREVWSREKAIKYFLEAGFKTVSHSDIGRNLSNYEQGTLSSEKIIDLAYKADSKNCEAIVISCTDLKAVEVINTIETNLGKPVITSNQAMIFALLRAFNLKPNDSFPGQLFKVIKK